MTQATQPSVFGSSIVVSLATLLSRLLGLLRDIVWAVFFGAGGAQEAFLIAFKIPNFLRRLFAEGAFNQAFVPVLAEFKQREGDASVRRLVMAVQLYLGGIVGLLTLVAVIGSPGIAWLFASGFYDEPEKLASVADFLRLTFPYLWFISLTALGASVLHSYQHFASPALAPVILNLCLIAATVGFRDNFSTGQTALAWGVFIAGLAQWLFLWPALLKTGVWSLWPWHFRHPGVGKILRLMVPGLFAVSVSQINLLLDTILASWLEDGAVSWLYYSDRLTELPLGVIGIAIATVLLPRLSTQHAQSDAPMFERTLAWAIRAVLAIGLPAMVALVLIPAPLLTLLFGHGAFTQADVLQASSSLAAYALGLPAFMLIKILAPAFFARQNMGAPVRIGVQAMFCNMLFNLILIWPLGHVGLALATSLSAWLNACLLALWLRREQRLPALPLWLPAGIQISIASLLMGALLLWLRGIEWFQPSAALLQQLGAVASLVTLGLLGYLVALRLTGLSLHELRRP